MRVTLKCYLYICRWALLWHIKTLRKEVGRTKILMHFSHIRIFLPPGNVVLFGVTGVLKCQSGRLPQATMGVGEELKTSTQIRNI